jgi:diaminopropionate ammonia-lyase
MDHLLNPRASAGARGLFGPDEYARVRAFFAGRHDLGPTPLHRLGGLARGLGIGGILLKDESQRLDLRAFKVVGVTYAVHRLRESGRLPDGRPLACATAGNHGRAVARAARLAGLPAIVYVPGATVPARVEAIAREGARVERIDGCYEDAVTRLARDADAHGWSIVSDVAWTGYEEIPRLIMSGYTHILDEAAVQWRGAGVDRPDLAIVQGGVGGLVAAAASWLAFTCPGRRPFMIAAEPAEAACLLASARAGRPTTLDGPLTTVMAGLRCGQMSTAAWPAVETAVDGVIAIEDAATEDAMRRLAHPAAGDPAVEAGASGACGLAALVALAGDDRLAPLRRASGLGSESVVLVVNTEGATDPEHYRAVIQAG